ncbi:MAG: folate-binding protein [marine bacterium B5-7]|nr:MAG: folate-binding protein [marine bacterium B5-7]
MHETWQVFLEKEGATILNNDVIDFNDSSINISETPFITPLSGFSMLAVAGNDRHEFLHGQFINDLNLIEEPAAQISAWCNPKGQVISNFLIINTGIAYLLIFKTDLKEFVQKRLTMFVMRSDVTINDISDSSPLLGLANVLPNCSNLASLNSNLPSSPGEVNAVDGLIIINLPDGSNRHLITGNVESLIRNISNFKDSVSMTGSHIWDLLDILAGLPWVTSLTQEQYLPQMLNLDALKGLSYQKGCYPGQEVIARLHYRGEVKKRLSLIQSEQPLSIDKQLISEQSDSKAGTIINAATHPDELCYALAVIDRDKLNDKLLIEGKAITIIDLPYEINL